MNFFLLSGSHRPESQSAKVTHWIDYAVNELFPDDNTYLYELKNNPLPLWNDWFWDKESEQYKQFEPTRLPLQEKLKNSDAFVIVTPERSGSVAPGVKNFLLYCSAKEMGNKPSLIVTVSASRGGRYPVAELRMSSYKNTQLVHIPQHVIIDHVKEKLNDHSLEASEKDDAYIRERLQYSLKMLHVYASALQQVRESDVPDFEKYGNGM